MLKIKKKFFSHFTDTVSCSQEMSLADQRGPALVLPRIVPVVETKACHPWPVIDRVDFRIVGGSNYALQKTFVNRVICSNYMFIYNVVKLSRKREAVLKLRMNP
jgi:hypothetical protein